MFIQKLCFCHFIFPKICKRGAGIRAGGGGLEKCSKIDKRGGHYSVLESTLRKTSLKQTAIQHHHAKCMICNSDIIICLSQRKNKAFWLVFKRVFSVLYVQIKKILKTLCMYMFENG